MVYVVTWYIGDSCVPSRKYYQRRSYAVRFKERLENRGYKVFLFEFSDFILTKSE